MLSAPVMNFIKISTKVVMGVHKLSNYGSSMCTVFWFLDIT